MTWDCWLSLGLQADELGAAGGEAGRRASMLILAAMDELIRLARRPDEPLQ